MFSDEYDYSMTRGTDQKTFQEPFGTENPFVAMVTVYEGYLKKITCYFSDLLSMSLLFVQLILNLYNSCYINFVNLALSLFS